MIKKYFKVKIKFHTITKNLLKYDEWNNYKSVSFYFVNI